MNEARALWNGKGILQNKETERKKTIAAMVDIYCRVKHQTHGELCMECSELLAYSEIRLDNCPFGENKSTCIKCLVHCYKPDMKEKVKAYHALFWTKNATVPPNFSIASCMG